MKLHSKFFVLGAVIAFSAAFASADEIQVGSYATGASAGVYGNSAVAFSDSSTAPVTPYTGGAFSGFTTQTGLGTPTTGTVALTNVTPTWTAAQGASSWVSYGQTGPGTPEGSQPGGTYSPNGNYFFTSTFSFAGPESNYSGSLDVLADDTVTVFLNGIQQNIPTDPGNFSLCSDGAPNCTVATLVTLNSADFNSDGLDNVLTFQVTQGNSVDVGLDFVGEVAATPEPSSLILLGTGLLGAAGEVFRRMRSQA